MSTKRKLPPKLGQPMVKQSAKVLGKGNLDESRTVVSAGGSAIKSNVNGRTVIDISSEGEEDGDGDQEDSDQGSGDESAAEADVAMEDADALLPEDAEESGEPSFGDLVRANASEPIDVAGAFEDPSRAVSYPRGMQIQPPSGASLGTVLTQALKTNDVTLLESCLHTPDVTVIRATIQRLDSPLAGSLLQKLADRLHRKPGRAGSLMVWVQWTLVAHGGYLATQPDLIKKLTDLNKVIDERAKGLQSLLSLKGKLDMLEAQIELRRTMQNQRRRLDDGEDDEEVIYVEGQESEEEEEVARPKRLAANGDLEDISDGSEVSEDMPMTNGAIADSEEEDDSSEGDLIDDEAEETDVETNDEDEVDHDDQDSEDEETDDARPNKIPRISGQFSKKR